MCGVRSGSGGAWYVLSLSLFTPRTRCGFVIFCITISARKTNVSVSLSFKALPFNVTVVRTTRARALKVETATMMMPA